MLRYSILQNLRHWVSSVIYWSVDLERKKMYSLNYDSKKQVKSNLPQWLCLINKWTKDSLRQPALASPSPWQLCHLKWEVSPGSSKSICQTLMTTSQSCPGHSEKYDLSSSGHISKVYLGCDWTMNVYLLVRSGLVGLFQYYASVALWTVDFLSL